MQDWDDQFGYELVPAEVQLAYSQPDAALKQRIDLAIRQAVAQQHARHAIAKRSSGHYDLPTLSAASLDRQGRAGGFKSPRDHYLSRVGQSPYVSGSSYASGSGYSATPGSPSQDSRSETIRRLDDHLRHAAEEIRNSQPNGGEDGNPPDRSTATAAAGSSPSGSSASGSLPSGSLPSGSSPSGSLPSGTSASEVDLSLSYAGSPPRLGDASAAPTGQLQPPTQSNPFLSDASLGVAETPDSASTAGANDGPDSTAKSPGKSGQQAVTADARAAGGQSASGGMTMPQAAANSQQPPPPGGGSSTMSGSQQQAGQATQSPPQVNSSASASKEMVQRQGRDWATSPQPGRGQWQSDRANHSCGVLRRPIRAAAPWYRRGHGNVWLLRRGNQSRHPTARHGRS